MEKVIKLNQKMNLIERVTFANWS